MDSDMAISRVIEDFNSSESLDEKLRLLKTFSQTLKKQHRNSASPSPSQTLSSTQSTKIFAAFTPIVLTESHSTTLRVVLESLLNRTYDANLHDDMISRQISNITNPYDIVPVLHWNVSKHLLISAQNDFLNRKTASPEHSPVGKLIELCSDELRSRDGDANLNKLLDPLRSLLTLRCELISAADQETCRTCCDIIIGILEQKTIHKDACSKAGIIAVSLRFTLEGGRDGGFDFKNLWEGNCKNNSMSQISLARGAISVFSEPTTLLTSTLFPPLLTLSKSPNFELSYYALQALESLYSRCLLYYSQPSATDKLKREIIDMCNVAVNYVLDTLEVKSKLIVDVLSSSFQHLIKIIMLTAPSNLDGLVQRVLSLPSSRRGKFKALKFLMDVVGAPAIVAKSPDLILDLCEVVCSKNSSTGGLSAHLLTHLLSKLKKNGKNDKEDTNDNDNNVRAWAKLWTTPLSVNIMSGTQQTRFRALVYLLPSILKIASAKEIPVVSASILLELKSLQTSNYVNNIDVNAGTSTSTNSKRNYDNSKNFASYWSSTDIFMVAVMELIRLTKSLTSVVSVPLDNTINLIVSLPFLYSCLKHRHVGIRIATLQSLVASSSPCEPINTDSISLLVDHLPLSLKSDSPSVNRDIGRVLTVAMRRLASDGERLATFVQSVVRKAVDSCFYIGSVFEREIAGLDCITSICEALKNKATSAKEELIVWLSSSEVFDRIYSCLFSVWNKTRIAAFALLKRILNLKQRVAPNSVLSNVCSQSPDKVKSHAYDLVASPRQRESDSGSNIFQVLYIADGNKLSFAEEIVTKLEEKITLMKTVFAQFGDARDGTKLPMAYGLMSTVNLCLLQGLKEEDLSKKKALQLRVAEICVKSLKMSFAVVSDYHVDEESQNSAVNNATLNVNGGCLGANTSFGGLQTSGSERQSRIGIQRIVVGCWLLAKEASGLLATNVCAFDFTDSDHSVELVEEAGRIMLTTLSTLKHQGAAFACQRALAKISSFCFNSAREDLRRLPGGWLKSLLDSISDKDTVHESTLRRSSGYAFGFLSILGALLKSKADAGGLFASVMKELVRLSLPPIEEMAAVERVLQMKLNFLAMEGEKGADHNFVSKGDYSAKSRVHALNILRLMMLDSGLTNNMVAYAGDCLTSSILGFNAGEWTVENSSMMVYTAVMLRIIDSDKNAAQESETASAGNIVNANAISAGELFGKYGQLEKFVYRNLEEAVADAEIARGIDNRTYPLLLLLSRMGGSRGGGGEESFGRFVSLISGCLSHKYHKVRMMASRAICVFLAERDRKEGLMVDYCLEWMGRAKGKDENAVHGCSMLITRLVRLDGALDEVRGKLLRRVIETARANFMACWEVFKVIEALLREEEVEEEERSLMIACAVKFLRRDGGEDDKPGWALASSSAASIASLTNDISTLNAVFACGFDARVALCKGLKKRIGKEIGVKDFVELDKVVWEELLNEIKRTPGHHVPSLRRLARCWLECRYRGVDDDVGSIVGEAEVVDVALRIRNGFGKGNELEGCALEILGVVLHTAEGKKKAKLVKEFARCCLGAANKLGLWRVRHSIAVAIGFSGILRASGNGDINSDVERARSQMFLVLLDLVQDSDCDVRAAASNAIGGKGDGALSQQVLKEGWREYWRRDTGGSKEAAGEWFCKGAELDYEGGVEEIERDIFEGEEPNGFEERMLSNELAVEGWIESGGADIHGGGVHQGLLKKWNEFCEKYEKLNFDAPEVFRGAHTLVCGMVCMGGGGEGTEKIQPEKLPRTIREGVFKVLKKEVHGRGLDK